MTAVTLIVTLSRVITSCGGTVRVTIRWSTLTIRVIIGGTQNTPGPFAPVRLPRIKITPRSYCCTIRSPERKKKMTIRTTNATSVHSNGSMTSLLLYLSISSHLIPLLKKTADEYRSSIESEQVEHANANP